MAAAQANVIDFSTRHLAPADAVQLWHDVFCETVMCSDPVFLNRDAFSVDFSYRGIGRTGLLKADMAAISHRRDRRHVARDGERDVSIMFAEGGQMSYERGRDRIVLDRRTCCVGVRTEPYAATWAVPTRMFTVEVPALLLDEVGAPRDRRFLDLPRSDPVVRMIRAYAQMVWALDPAMRAANAAHIDVHIASLAADVMHRAGARTGGLVRDSERALQVLALIERNFADPALDIAEAARRLNLTPAIIRSAMSHTGETFSRALNRRRLEVARARLGTGGERISDIALDCGFSDISYFNRLFRARFGVSPRSARRSTTGQGLGQTGIDDPDQDDFVQE